MEFFKLSYGFSAPYVFLLDGSFIHAIMKTELNIWESFEKIVDDNIKLKVTNCILNELRSVGEKA